MVMKKILLLITGILIFISVPVIVFFVGQQQELRSKAAPATTLSIQPDTASVAVGATVSCKVMINTAENRVASARVSILFDQTKFEALSITNSTLAPRILNQGTVGSGTATITVAAENTAKPITGQGEIAVLRLKAISGSAGPIAIQFAPDTFVAGIGENTVNVLTSSQPGSVTITGGSSQTLANSTPTPTVMPLTLTTTPLSTNSPEILTQTATSSALTLHVSAEATRSGKPLIQGTASASATVTVVIHSTPAQTTVVTADENGNWQTVPTTALSTGTYTVVVTALLPTLGVSETLSSTFTIGGGIGGEDTNGTIGDEIPESGFIGNTLILIFASGILIILGILSHTAIRI